MADRWREFLMHPATQMGAGIMVGSDPNREGLGGLGLGIMSAREGLLEQEKLRQEGLTSGLADYSKTPTYFRDPETGEYRIGQLSPTGEVHFPNVPGGLEAVRPVTHQDLGDVMASYRYGETVPTATQPIRPGPETRPEYQARQTEAKTAARLQTERREEARARLPGAMIDARRTFNRLNQLRSHDALAAAVGASSWLPVIRGTDRADFVARMNQITGGAFLQAFDQLKGGGQITQIEGEKATAAITRMSEATSEEAFFAAMNDYAEAIQDGILKLQAAAEQEQTGIDIPWQVKPTRVSGSGTGRLSRRERRERLKQIRQERGR